MGPPNYKNLPSILQSKLILIRHACSIQNKRIGELIAQGPDADITDYMNMQADKEYIDSELSLDGWSQCAVCAQLIENCQFDAVFVSPMLRAL